MIRIGSTFPESYGFVIEAKLLCNITLLNDTLDQEKISKNVPTVKSLCKVFDSNFEPAVFSYDGFI